MRAARQLSTMPPTFQGSDCYCLLRWCRAVSAVDLMNTRAQCCSIGLQSAANPARASSISATLRNTRFAALCLSPSRIAPPRTIPRSSAMRVRRTRVAASGLDMFSMLLTWRRVGAGPAVFLDCPHSRSSSLADTSAGALRTNCTARRSYECRFRVKAQAQGVRAESFPRRAPPGPTTSCGPSRTSSCGSTRRSSSSAPTSA